MIGKKELVISNIYRYCYALKEQDQVKLELEKLERSVGVKSPKFDNSPVGYTGTRDEKLLNYSIKKEKLDNELKSWEEEAKVYFNILHLFELEQTDVEFLKLIYKDNLKYEEIAAKLFYNDKSYVSRKKDNLLERLSKFV